MALLLFAVGVTASGRARAQDDHPSPWHLDLELGYGSQSISFVTSSELSPLCPSGTCDPGELDLPLLRGGVAVGHGGFSVEATLATPARSTVHGPLLVWSAGVRIDTAWDALFSLSFRFAFVSRWGGLPGQGGRAGVGAQLRLWQPLVLFAEASIDAVTVPTSMNISGTLFSYATFLGGGLRVSFGH